MSISKLKPVSINANLYTKKVFYFMFMPIGMPYGKTYQEAKSKGHVIDDSFGIIEKGKMLGPSWIGVKVDKADNLTIPFKGEFQVVEIMGAYNQIKLAYDQIMKENSQANEFYNIYYNGPQDVPENELKTWILFK